MLIPPVKPLRDCIDRLQLIADTNKHSHRYGASCSLALLLRLRLPNRDAAAAKIKHVECKADVRIV